MWHHMLRTVCLALIIPATAILIIFFFEYLPRIRGEEMSYPGRLTGTPQKIKPVRRNRR